MRGVDCSSHRRLHRCPRSIGPLVGSIDHHSRLGSIDRSDQIDADRNLVADRILDRSMMSRVDLDQRGTVPPGRHLGNVVDGTLFKFARLCYFWNVSIEKNKAKNMHEGTYNSLNHPRLLVGSSLTGEVKSDRQGELENSLVEEDCV